VIGKVIGRSVISAPGARPPLGAVAIHLA
jgi:hypothetical protein